jgi:hypothetical protein
MNNQLLVGLVLIAFGIGLAILAYMILNSRSKSAEEESPDTGDEETAELEGFSADDLHDEDLASVPTEAHEVKPAATGPSEEIEQETGAEPPVRLPSDTPAAPEPDQGPRIQVATLLRDEVSGDLIVKVGDQEYDDPEALKASRHWTRLEYAAKDLNAWLRAPEPERTVAVERESDASERKPSSMIEQINDILQERIESSGRSDLAVRLVEGVGGTARVLIGVNSYEIADVPNPEIKALIREAVAAWEATQ